MVNNTLQKKIMRRVYYAFAMRLATHPATLNSFVLVLALYGLGQLVHVARVVDNLMTTQVGDLVPHLVRVFSQADVLTLIVFGICVFATLSVGLQLRMPRFRYETYQAV